MSKLSFKLICKAHMSNCRGRHECTLIELHEDDFVVAIDIFKANLATIPIFRRHINIAEMPNVLISSALDEAIKNKKFIFRDAIVLPNNDVRQGTIRTFNKDLFETKEHSFEELDN